MKNMLKGCKTNNMTSFNIQYTNFKNKKNWNERQGFAQGNTCKSRTAMQRSNKHTNTHHVQKINCIVRNGPAPLDS